MFNEFEDILKDFLRNDFKTAQMSKSEVYKNCVENSSLAQDFLFSFGNVSKRWNKMTVIERLEAIDNLKNSGNTKDTITIFNYLIKNGNTDLLKREVSSMNYKVHSLNDSQTYKAHALACVTCENYDLAVQSIKKIGNSNSNLEEILGMIYYNFKNYPAASTYFADVKNPKKPRTTTLLKAVSDYNSNLITPEKCENQLKPILENSVQANNFLGVIYFNEGYSNRASDFFTNEVALTKGKPESRINLLKVEYSKDKKSVMSEMGRHIYELEMDPEKILGILEKEKMDVPHYTIPLRKTIIDLLN